MKPNVKKFKSFLTKKNKRGILEEDYLDKKLKEYYKKVDNEVPKSFEDAIQTAFSSKKDKKFLKFIAKKQNFIDKIKFIKEKLSRSFLKVSQLAVVLFSCLCVTYFVHATSIVDYLAGFFNLSDININNSGIEQALEKGELQNVYMDYIRTEGVGVKVSYVLMNDLNLYLVFDIETDFSLKERDVNNVNFQRLVITNENGETVYNQYMNDNFKGNKVVVQDEHHMKNLIFMFSDGIPESKKLNIFFNQIVLYKSNDVSSNESDLNENSANINFEYSLDLENTIKQIEISYDINIKQNENSAVNIKKAIFDETGLNLLIESENSNMKVNLKSLFSKREYNNFYLIKWLSDLRKEFIINIPEIKEKDKIDLEIETDNGVNRYELIKNR